MKTKCALGLAGALLMFAHLHAGDGSGTKALADELVGDYTITAGEKNGKQTPSEEIKDVTVRIAKNAITTFDKDRKQLYAATYKLDASKKPWRITMTATISPAKGDGTVSEGLIEKEGDTVRLIYALPKGKAPTEFKTGDQQQMFTLKRSSK